MINFNKQKIFLGIAVVFFSVIIFSFGFSFGQRQVVCPVCQPEDINFSLFWEAYNELLKTFIDPSKLDHQKIIYGAISGMTESLGDPYTVFYTPEETKMFQQDLSGSFEGIGAEVGLKENQLTIIAPLKNTPAAKAGLKPGDVIVKIGDKETYNMTVEEAVRLIRGKGGTEVVLTVFREDWNDTKEIKIIRGIIDIPSIEWKLLASPGEAGGKDGNVAYINIYHFDQALPLRFNQVAFEILNSPAEKIILDLRNNPGGYLDVSQEIAGWFLEKDQIVTIEDFGGKKDNEYYKAEGNSAFADYPMVVLINEGSASASEILAGALRDNRKIQLVGEKSFGKGSVQEIVDLRDGSSIKITIAKWLTPSGVSISEQGLDPDVTVKSEEGEENKEKDVQLEKALEIIQSIK